MKIILIFFLALILVLEASDKRDEEFKQCCIKGGMECLKFCKVNLFKKFSEDNIIL